MAATLPSLMAALLAREQAQPPDRMTLEERERPEPGIGDVLIQVGAASFTPTELQWPSTWVDRSGRDRRPTIPGHEVSGTVFDLIGGDVLHRSWPMVRPGGSIVSVVEAPDGERSDVNNVFFVVEPNGDQLTELARRIETLRPVVGTVGTLSDGPRVWAEKVAGGIPGKVVLTPSSPAAG
jgi:NADPH:quinone reductase-like Zn-dependent oxidoreductase